MIIRLFRPQKFIHKQKLSSFFLSNSIRALARYFKNQINPVFSKNFLKKSFKFVPNKKSNIVAFNLSLVFLPAEVDFVTKKKAIKKTRLKLVIPVMSK